MKKNDWILVIATGIYSMLFYEQTAGINFLIFTVALIICLVIKYPSVLKNNKWKLAATGSLLSSICVGYYGNVLSVTANIISLSILSGLSINNNSSVILSALFSFYSYFSSPVFMYLDRIEKRLNEKEIPSNIIYKRVLVIGIPILITLLFFFMYRASNPLFNNFSQKINFDFISISWIVFTAGGFILLYGFFNHKKIKTLSDLDENASNELSRVNEHFTIIFGKELNIDDEYFSGKILFILLNALLLIVNLLDINFLFIDGKLPAGVTYSEFVHQGTGMLIVSIIIAVAIILFYFRGSLNFHEKGKTLKTLAYLWIAQNAFMLISTALRNGMYIHEYGLTYKRIGVYVYLTLTLIGLSSIVIKIFKQKTNNYLFRTNGWLFYTVLIFACFFDWDGIITNFNINSIKKVEKDYLVCLSYATLPKLFLLQENEKGQNKKVEITKSENNIGDYLVEDNYTPLSFDEKLSTHFYQFLIENERLSWQSWYFENMETYEGLVYLNGYNKIKRLELPHMEINSLKLLLPFNNINELNLNLNKLSNARELSSFTSLTKLDLRANKINSIEGLEKLQKLEFLDLKFNPIKNYAPLYTLKGLKELSISNITPSQLKMLKKNLPKTNIIIN